MRTSDPDYWPAKLREAERRVRVAAKELARRTTPNGHARKTPEYEAALGELLEAVSGLLGVRSATPREHR